jgi:hypothetical protein
MRTRVGRTFHQHVNSPYTVAMQIHLAFFVDDYSSLALEDKESVRGFIQLRDAVFDVPGPCKYCVLSDCHMAKEV